MTWWMWVTALFLYLQIGYWIGRLSWDVWRKYAANERTQSVVMMLLFPVSSMGDEAPQLPEKDRGIGILLGTFYAANEREQYCRCIAAIWPLRIVWNVPIAGAYFSYKLLIYALAAFTSGPGVLLSGLASRIAAWRKRRRSVRAQSSEASSEPFLIRAERIARLTETRMRIDTELAELQLEQESESGSAYRGVGRGA